MLDPAASIADLGAEVREARRTLGLTQTDVAERAGVSRPTIDRLENRRSADIGYRPLLRILNAVGLDLRLTTLNRGRPTLEDLEAERAAERAAERERR